MQVRCPHCQGPVEIIDDSSFESISCGSCGHCFDFVLDETVAQQETPKSVAHFRLDALLGTGAFGSVWKAHDSELDRTVAVKIPRRGQLDATGAEQFMREARAAAQLKHPNIVPVHEVGRDEEQIYIVSDYIDGISLAEWLTARRPSPTEAARLCAQIADAVHHAHEAGIIHRDLKPSNIMLDGKDQPYIMDFGLAKREVGEITMTAEGKLLGTPAYMSPEQARGDSHAADRRSDVYALGVVLFELLTGEKPFRGSSRMLLHQVIHDEPPGPRKLNGAVPRDLHTICLKCLQKEPRSRYQDADQLKAELERFLAGEPIRARPIGPLARGWRVCKRNPVTASLAAAAVFLLIGGIVTLSVANVTTRRALADAEQAREKETKARRRAEDAQRKLERTLELYGGQVTSLTTNLAELAKAHRTVGYTGSRLGFSEDAIAAHRRALELQKQLVSESRDDNSLRLLATDHMRVGILEHQVGDADKALAAFQSAVRIRTELITEFGVTTEHSRIASDYGRIAAVHEEQDQLVEALAARRKAVQMLEEGPQSQNFGLGIAYEQLGQLYERLKDTSAATDAFTNSLAYRQYLLRARLRGSNAQIVATSYYDISRAHRNLGQTADSLAAIEKCVDLRQQLLKKHGNQYRYPLAVAYNMAGVVHQDDGQYVAAADAYRQAIEQFQKLIEESDERISYYIELGRVRTNLAKVYRHQDQWTEALRTLELALESLDFAADRDPRNSSLSRLQRVALGEQTRALGKLGRHSEAITSAEQALELATGSVATEYRIKLAIALGRDGQYQRAMAEMDKLGDLEDYHLYDAACAYALAAAAIKKSSMQDEPDRDEKATDYANRSLALLEQASANGYFENSDRVTLINEDPDLNALRDREAFQQFLQSLQ